MQKSKQEELEKEFAKKFSRYVKMGSLLRELSKRDYEILNWFIFKLSQILKQKEEAIDFISVSITNEAGDEYIKKAADFNSAQYELLLKLFIDFHTQALSSLKEKVEGFRKIISKNAPDIIKNTKETLHWYADAGYNQAISDIISLIEEEK